MAQNVALIGIANGGKNNKIKKLTFHFLSFISTQIYTDVTSQNVTSIHPARDSVPILKSFLLHPSALSSFILEGVTSFSASLDFQPPSQNILPVQINLRTPKEDKTREELCLFGEITLRAEASLLISRGRRI